MFLTSILPLDPDSKLLVVLTRGNVSLLLITSILITSILITFSDDLVIKLFRN